MTKTNATVPTHRHPPIKNWGGLIYTLFSAIVIIAGTYLAIRWAQGDWRHDENSDSLARETGLLHATSTPKGAEVYIDGKLTSVTDNTIYLSPGEYDVKISKDGYSSWEKHIIIQKALVSQTGATLYPYSPNINTITYTGVKRPLASPDGSKILFYTNTASVRAKNGLYVLDVTNLQHSPQQICDDDPDYDLETAQLLWSPDSNDILVVTPAKTLLLAANRFVNLQSTPDVSLQLATTLSAWEQDIAAREQQYASKIPPAALQTIKNHAKNLFLSPDQTKLLYTATDSATIPSDLITALPAPNSQPEVRTLEPNHLYIYDAYEDRNYALGEAAATSSAKILLSEPKPLTTNRRVFQETPVVSHSLVAADLDQTLQNFSDYYGSPTTRAWTWLPDSTHLVTTHGEQIDIITYDGTNQTAIYSGPFIGNFLLPATDNNSILMLANFNPNAPNNIYAVQLTK